MTNPTNAVKSIEENPKLLESLLQSDEDKVKYVKLSNKMDMQLREQAEKLKTTQGALLGLGLMFLLMLLVDHE